MFRRIAAEPPVVRMQTDSVLPQGTGLGSAQPTVTLHLHCLLRWSCAVCNCVLADGGNLSHYTDDGRPGFFALAKNSCGARSHLKNCFQRANPKPQMLRPRASATALL